MREEFSVRIGKIRSKDAGKGVMRLDPQLVAKYDIEEGQILVLEGGKRAAVRAVKGYFKDVGTDLGRVDGMVRRNADLEIGATVNVRVCKETVARSICLVPQKELKLTGGEQLLRNMLGGFALMQGNLLDINVMGNRYLMEVVSFKPSESDAVAVGPKTRIKFGSDKLASLVTTRAVMAVPQTVYEDVGGLEEEIKRMREMVELPLNHPELFERLGVEPPKGVLLHGPPGTGKTLLAKAVASETQSSFYYIAGPEVMSKFFGESEQKIRRIFDKARANAPSIIFIDEIDSIAPKRDETSQDMERRIVAQLLTLLDGMEARGEVVVIGATNRPNALDEALRRPGRFDREIVIGIPNRNERLEILQIHTRGMPLGADLVLSDLADLTHGYVGADLHALCKEAALNSLRDVVEGVEFEDERVPAEVLGNLTVGKADFEEAFRHQEPSAMREVLIQKPDVKWSDIGGLEEAKQQIVESVQWPLLYPALYKHLDISPPKGIMLHGPPGTGKTMLAKAVATETNVNFISVKGAEFHSRWLGESEKAVRKTFKKAKQSSPCIIFFDEIDAITPRRTGGGGDSQAVERVVSQMLTEMDGIEKLHGVVMIGATNRIDIIDPALLRPGRFDRHVCVGAPDAGARKEIIRIHTRDKPLAEDVRPEAIVERCEGFTGADIAHLCNEAGMLALREYVREMDGIGPPGETTRRGEELTEDQKAEYRIRKRHFSLAFEEMRPSAPGGDENDAMGRDIVGGPE